jgi:cellulase
MYSLLPFLGATALLLSPVSAHGFVKSVTIKGQSTPGADPVWFYLPTNQRAQTAGWNALNQDNGFVEPNSFSSPAGDVNCHKSATPGRLYANVTAGDTVQFNWNTWPDSHKGPILNYIAPCDGT